MKLKGKGFPVYKKENELVTYTLHHIKFLKIFLERKKELLFTELA
jgi:hypothetical protein